MISRSRAGDLKRLIDKTQFAISNEETRYYLNGIFLHATEVDGQPMLRAVATDGHRLARRRNRRRPQGAVGHARRDRAAQGRGRGAKADRGSRRRGCASSFRRRKSASPSATVVLTSKLIDGTFPDYVRVIPSGNDKRLIVERSAFRRRGRSRLDHFVGARPRRQTRGGGRQADALGHQSGFRLGAGGARRRLRRRRRSTSASTPAICSTSPSSSTATRRCSNSPIPARRRSCRTATARARSMC